MTNKLVFWENIISPHKSNFFQELSNSKYEVTLIVEEEMYEFRKLQGWSMPEIGNVNLIVAPEDIDNIFKEHRDSIHIFNGINTYKLITKGFKKAIKTRCNIGIMSEPYWSFGVKGKLRKIRSVYHCIRYNKHIDFILAIGNGGVNWFEKSGFKKSKIFDWAYFTQNVETSKLKKVNRKSIDVLYVGQLIKRKNIEELLRQYVLIPNNIKHKLTIVGRGNLKEYVIKYKNEYPDKIDYIESLPNEEVKLKIFNSDLLVLASLYDGWGAVINESISVGTPVITSSNCGASVLIKDFRGEVYKHHKLLGTTIKKWIHKKDLKENRNKIIDWSSNISGAFAVQYFDEIIHVVYNNGKNINVPWMK